MHKITDAAIADLKAKYAPAELNLISNEALDFECVAKTPTRGEWDRFRSMQSDENQSHLALRTLAMACIVCPTPDEFRAILDLHPGLAETVGGQLVRIAKVSSASTYRKL